MKGKSYDITVDVNLDYLDEVLFVRQVCSVSVLLPFSTLFSMDESHYAQLAFKEWKAMLGQCFHKSSTKVPVASCFFFAALLSVFLVTIVNISLKI